MFTVNKLGCNWTTQIEDEEDWMPFGQIASLHHERIRSKMKDELKRYSFGWRGEIFGWRQLYWHYMYILRSLSGKFSSQLQNKIIFLLRWRFFRVYSLNWAKGLSFVSWHDWSKHHDLHDYCDASDLVLFGFQNSLLNLQLLLPNVEYPFSSW